MRWGQEKGEFEDRLGKVSKTPSQQPNESEKGLEAWLKWLSALRLWFNPQYHKN
jgi:hypothetical protein